MDDPPALPPLALSVASDSSLCFVCFGSTGSVVWVEEGGEEDCFGEWFLDAKRDSEPEKVGIDKPTGLETGDETCTTGTINGQLIARGDDAGEDDVIWIDVLVEVY